MKASITEALSALVVAIAVLLVSTLIVAMIVPTENMSQVIIAALIVVFVGAFISHIVVRCSVSTIECPSGNQASTDKFSFDGIFSRPGAWIGYVERLIFLVAFWLPEYRIIFWWLGFKVASKWNVWKMISNQRKDNDFDESRKLGACLFTRFIVGTATNILIAAAVSALVKYGEMAT